MPLMPGSQTTLRSALRAGPLPPSQAIDVVTEVAAALSRRHRSGHAHGAVGIDTVVIGRDGHARLRDNPGTDGEGLTSLDDFDRDTSALGPLLAQLCGGRDRLPPAALSLVERAEAGDIATPAAFAAESGALGARHRPQPPGLVPPYEGVEPAFNSPRESSLDDLFDDAPPATPVAAAELPPELSPRPHHSSGQRRLGTWVAGLDPGRRRAGLAALCVLALLVVALVVLVALPSGSHHSASPAPPTHAAAKPSARGSSSASPTPSAQSASPSSKASPAAGPLQVAGVSAYDPDGDGTEHNSDAGLAVDGDPSSAWATDRYTTPDLGGLKPGVGLVVDLGRARQISEVQLGFDVAGTSFSLYAGASPDGLEQGTAIGSAVDAAQQASVPLAHPARARYVLVWLTKIPPTDGGGYRGTISDIRVSGS